MSFLSLAFLAALPLALAPVVLHLIDRQRNVVIPWGAMQFLMEAATKRTQARRLREWLLLLLRVLAVACLVFALARPIVHATWFRTQPRRELIVVVDNSLSMQRQRGEQSLLQAAVERARSLVAAPHPGQTARLLVTSPYPTWLPGTTSSSAKTPDGEDILTTIRATESHGDFLAALITAVQAERDPLAIERRIIVLTDGQAADWNVADDSGWQDLRKLISASPVGITLNFERLGDMTSLAPNLAINRLRATRTVVGIDQPLTITAEIQNYGTIPSAEGTVSFRVGDEVLQSDPLPSIDPGAVVELTCKHGFTTLGAHRVACQLERTDPLEPDNQDVLIVDVRDEIPVLIVESAGDTDEVEQDAFFIETALGWADGERVNQSSIFVPKTASLLQLTRMDLAPYHAVIIPHLTDLDDDVVQMLKEYVADGGGLWVAVGPRTDVDRFNRRWFEEHQGLVPMALDRIIDESADPEHRTLFNPFTSNHPAMQELVDQRKLDTGDIAVSRRFRFTPLPEEHEASVLLTLTNGDPVVVEKRFGRGRVFVQGVPLRMPWSDLVRSQAFVVLVQQWLSYLTQPRATHHNLSPGEPIVLTVAGTESTAATLITPAADEVEIAADLLGNSAIFRTSRTSLPGDYALEVGLSGDQIPFRVHRDAAESDLTPLFASDEQRIADLCTYQPPMRGDSSATLAATDPLWPVLWMLLIGLLVGELFLASTISRKRFGSAGVADFAEQTLTAQSSLTVQTGRHKKAVRPPRSPSATVSTR